MSARPIAPTWREILANDQPSSGNLTGILMSVESGHIRLAKQTSYGDEYVATAPDAATAWQRLSRITGTSIQDLQRLRLTRIQ